MTVPLFVLIGDPFLCEEKRKEILEALQKKSGAKLSFNLRRAGEFPLKNLFSEARTLPFLAIAQVFCILEVDAFSKDDLASWEEHLKSPPPKTYFLFESENLDGKHPFLQWAGKAGQVYFLNPQGEKMMTRFIREKLHRAGKTLTREAGEMLEDRLGDSYSLLDSLIEQLILYAGSRSEIDRAAVETLDEKMERLEGEDLLEATAERNLTKALAALNDLLQVNFRDFPAVVGFLHWQFRRFWEAKRWLLEGKTESEISMRIRLSSSRAAGFFRQLGRFKKEELEKILEGLFQLDWELKSGRAEGRYEIERWLVSSVLPQA